MSDPRHLFDGLQQGRAHNPFEVLGWQVRRGETVIRAFMPTAEVVELVGMGPMQRIEGYDLFEIRVDEGLDQRPGEHYQIRWREHGEDGGMIEQVFVDGIPLGSDACSAEKN